MKRRRTSIEDIAREAGVANSTVSRALRDSPLISLDVRETIQRLAYEMGYTPNGIAQSLQNQRSYTIGLVVTAIADPFFAEVAKGVEEEARAGGFSVFLSTSHNDPSQQIAVIEMFQRRRVDGIIVADSQLTSVHKERILRADVPTVLVNSQTDEPPAWLHTVGVDDHAGGCLAVEHLLSLGHRAIGYLGVGNRPTSNQRRLEAYRKTLQGAGITPHESRIVIASAGDTGYEGDVAAGQALVGPLLAAGVTALFCYNDMVAIGVLTGCRDRGMILPRDLSVVGYDDIATAHYVTPPLTTIRQPKIQLGRVATQMLLGLLNNDQVHDHVLAPTFVQRASTTVCASGSGTTGL